MKRRIRDAWSVLKGEKVAVPKLTYQQRGRPYVTTSSNATATTTIWKRVAP